MSGKVTEFDQDWRLATLYITNKAAQYIWT